MNRVLCAVAVLLFAANIATADVISVTTRTALNANDSVGWSAFGAPGTDVSSDASVQSLGGISVAVSQPFYGLQIRQQGSDWSGDFTSGQMLLTNWNSPYAVTLTFSQAVYGAGVQIEPGQVQDTPAAFTVYVTAYNGTNVLGQFSTTGIKSNAADGSAPFLGVLSDTADITSLTYRVSVQTNGPYAGDLGMNFLSLKTTATPVSEPGALTLVAAGAVALLGLDRGRRRRRSRLN